jgi:hypothetical protein
MSAFSSVMRSIPGFAPSPPNQPSSPSRVAPLLPSSDDSYPDDEGHISKPISSRAPIVQSVLQPRATLLAKTMNKISPPTINSTATHTNHSGIVNTCTIDRTTVSTTLKRTANADTQSICNTQEQDLLKAFKQLQENQQIRRAKLQTALDLFLSKDIAAIGAEAMKSIE